MRTEEGHAELVQYAARLYEELQSGHAVARKLDIASTTAYRLLKEAGINLPDRHGPEIQQRKKALQGERAEAAVRDYAKGMPMQALRAKYEVSDFAIKTAVRDAGITSRPLGGQTEVFTEEEVAEIVRLYREGWSQTMIAARYGCNQIRISRLLRNRGCSDGDERRARGKRHGMWKGGRTITSHGYVQVWLASDDPLASMRDHTGYVLEHRLIVARWLGRPLTASETVHHIDGDRQNNRLENLQLRQGKHGIGSAYVCYDCGSHRVGPDRLKERRTDGRERWRS